MAGCLQRVVSKLQTLRLKARNMNYIGCQMANLCFNLSQLTNRPLTAETCERMRDLSRQWDKT
jgi:hypothetical protein